LVAAADPTPAIEESRYATVELNTTPSDPLMSGAPVKSMFQSDESAFRVVFDVDWGLLNAGSIAFMQNVGW
jgi:hypothetical protein